MPVCVNFYHPNIIKKIKKGYKKKCLWRYQNLLKEEKKKSGNMVVNVTKISQRMNGLVQKKY